MAFPDWTSDFFSGVVAESVRRIPADTKAEVDFILKHLGASPGNRILDAPCGAGRHAPAIAERGFEAHGIDASLVEVPLG